MFGRGGLLSLAWEAYQRSLLQYKGTDSATVDQTKQMEDFSNLWGDYWTVVREKW